MRFPSIPSLFLGVAMLFSATTQLVFADAAVRGVFNKVGSSSGFKNVCGTSSCVPTIVGGFVNLVVGLLGVALIAYVFYAGYLWMTSGGEEKNIEEAQQVIRNAVIGVFVVGFSFTIANVGIRLVTELFQPSDPPMQPEEAAPAAPGAPPAPTPPTRTAPPSPFAPGCRRSTCTPECVRQRCVGPLRSTSLFTCESTCQSECAAQCALDGAGLPGRTPDPLTDTPSSCRNPTGYRTCQAGCHDAANLRIASIPLSDSARRAARYTEEVLLCHDRCIRENCSR